MNLRKNMPTDKHKSSKTSKSSRSKTDKDKRRSKKDKEHRSSRKKHSKTKTVTPVEEVVEEVAAPPVAVTTTTPAVVEKVTKKRRVVDKESVLVDFDRLIALIDSEVEALRSAERGKVSGVKFLRSFNKSFKQLKKDVVRAMKQKRKNPNRAKNTSSGFMKPVKISGEMASFTGWDKDDLKSRVDVTKYICGYIRDHDLQNPADRRQIVPDRKLSSLLKLDKKSLKAEPLTYYSLQRKIQPHFV